MLVMRVDEVGWMNGWDVGVDIGCVLRFVDDA